MSQDLEIATERIGPQNDIALIRPHGFIDTNTAEQLHQVLAAVINQKCFRIIFDLHNTSYISSAGWGIFISEIHRVCGHGGALKLAALLPEVEEVFRILEFETILRAYATVDEAVRDFQ